MKTQGQLDYEADVRSRPYYHDGGKRPSWNGLSEIAQYSWNKGLMFPQQERNPQ